VSNESRPRWTKRATVTARNDFVTEARSKKARASALQRSSLKAAPCANSKPAAPAQASATTAAGATCG